MSAMKDLLLKLQFTLVNCRGQCYNGASNMMGHKTGVPKIIQDMQPIEQPRISNLLSSQALIRMQRWIPSYLKCYCNENFEFSFPVFLSVISYLDPKFHESANLFTI